MIKNPQATGTLYSKNKTFSLSLVLGSGSISDMHQRFTSYIMQHGLLLQNQRVLLAVSGGMDSMVMMDLFSKSSWPFAVAHVNYQLRGANSEKDQQFVEDKAKRLDVPFFTERFNTESEAASNGESIQMAARRLRYDWMEKIRRENGYDVIATAHHLDDAMETLLINITRGSGISGLKSIPKKTGHIIRPMLFSGRDEIEAYCRHAGIKFREDLSNRETKYVRNRIRHKVLPVFKELNPSVKETMTKFFERMEATETIYGMMIRWQKQACTKGEGKELRLSIEAIRALPSPHVFLYEFIKEYGFSGEMCENMISGTGLQAGKRFFSETHVALIDREDIIIYLKENAYIPEPRYVDSPDCTVNTAGQTFCFRSGKMTEQPSLPGGPYALMADMDKLSIPLVLRAWQAGDSIVPLGMKGRKKVSDLLTDSKIPLHKKKQTLVLTTARDEIIWVAGVRADERFKITPATKRYLYACFEQEKKDED